MLFHRQHSPDTDVDLEQIHGRLLEAVDAGLLPRAFAAAAARHEALRATFRWQDGGEPVQEIADHVDVHVESSQQPAMDDEQADAHVAREMAEDRRRPFDVAKAPVMRVRLLRSKREYVLHEAVTEAREVAFPNPGVLYNVVGGDDAGIWFAKAL